VVSKTRAGNFLSNIKQLILWRGCSQPCLLFTMWLRIIILLTLFSSCSQKIQDQTLFTDVSSASGIQFVNKLTETDSLHVLRFEYMYNGAGIGVGDFNGDGFQDIIFISNQESNQLYLNNGDLTFKDITTAAGVGGRKGWKTGVSIADINNDGRPDIYVCFSGVEKGVDRSNELYLNMGLKDGVPEFKEVAKQMGLDAPGTNSTQAVFFDYDLDNDLDMFLLNHATSFYSPLFNTHKLRNKRHPWFSNRLYKNNNSLFEDVSELSGIKGGGNNFGLGVCVSDINKDGWPDLYYTNDYEEQDFLLLNNQSGGFTDVTNSSFDHISKYGMGCDIADLNNDGWPDVLVADMMPEDNFRQKILRGPDEYDRYQFLVDSGYFHQNMRNTLQLNRGLNKNGKPVFSEIAQLSGISNTDWSWAPLMADFDNDGWKDIFITNGYWRDYTNMDFLNFGVTDYKKNHPGKPLGLDLVNQMPSTRIPNYAFRNEDGLQFSNQSLSWGINSTAVSNGAVYADFDNDGDLELLINNIGSKAQLYRNNAERNNRHFVRIILQDSGFTESKLGATVEVIGSNKKHQWKEGQVVRGYLSSVDPVLHFGMDTASEITTIRVYWPSGKINEYGPFPVDTSLILLPLSSNIQNQEVAGLPVFEDVTEISGFATLKYHPSLVDFKSQPSLPWQISGWGPSLGKADLNGDGLEDVFVGGGFGTPGQLYFQQNNGKWKAGAQAFETKSLEEQGNVLFLDADGDKDIDLFKVTNAAEDCLYLNDGRGYFVPSGFPLPVAADIRMAACSADFDRDGKPDLFIGGRTVPGEYGRIPGSYFLRNKSVSGKIAFERMDLEQDFQLKQPGLITDAHFLDINKDGWQDLVVAGEWMPVRLFLNESGRFREVTEELGLSAQAGLWTKIFPIDLDADGDLDLVGGNLGTNRAFYAAAGKPMELHRVPIGQNRIAPVLSYFWGNTKHPYASRDELAELWPVMKKRFLRYENYARASFDEVFNLPEWKDPSPLQVTQLKNCVFLNQQNTFDVNPLPPAFQLSPIMGLWSGNLDDDQLPDLFLVGNYYPFRVQMGRSDAGKGILKFSSFNNTESVLNLAHQGVVVNGDVRNMITVQMGDGSQQLIISKLDNPIQVLKTNNHDKKSQRTDSVASMGK
jgi:hypothetical protein